MVRALVPGAGRYPRWPGPPEEDAGTRGVLVVRPVQAADRSGGARASMHPSPSMTAMGDQDDAVAPSGRLVPSARCNGSPSRTALSSNRSTSAGSSLGRLGESRPPQLPDGRKPDWPGRQPDSRARAKPERRSGGEGRSPPLSYAGMCSQTAVRRRRTEAAMIKEGNERAFPHVRAAAVGLAGLEPAASSSSALEG
jgi:hypothetical protein